MNDSTKKEEKKSIMAHITLRQSRYGWAVYYEDTFLKFFKKKNLAWLYILDSASDDVRQLKIKGVIA